MGELELPDTCKYPDVIPIDTYDEDNKLVKVRYCMEDVDDKGDGRILHFDKHSGEVISVDYHFVKLRADKGTILMVPSHSIYGKVVELN